MTSPCESVLLDGVMQSFCVMLRHTKGVDSAVAMTYNDMTSQELYRVIGMMVLQKNDDILQCRYCVFTLQYHPCYGVPCSVQQCIRVVSLLRCIIASDLLACLLPLSCVTVGGRDNDTA